MFGITHTDIAMYQMIVDAGLSVAQAYSMRKHGTLPESLSKAIDEYEKSLSAEIGEEKS